MPPFSSVRDSSRSPLLQVAKTSVSVITAWLLSNLLLGQPLPIFAAIAALLVIQPSVNQSLAKGVERSFGVILGVLLAYGAGLVFGHSTWIVLGIVVVSLLLAWALRLTPGSSNQIPISAMLVLAVGGGVQNSGYAAERVIETLIGAAAGLLINVLIVPPVLIAPAHHAVTQLASDVAEVLDSLSAALKSPQSVEQLGGLLDQARNLRPLQRQAQAALTRAEESLLLNPRSGSHRKVLTGDRELMGKLAILVTRVLGISRAIHDRYDDQLPNEPIVRSIAIELSRAAHDLRLLSKGPRNAHDDVATADLPTLTAPLAIAAPHPEHWILIGSLMEDIRRVREEITGTADR